MRRIFSLCALRVGVARNSGVRITMRQQASAVPPLGAATGASTAGAAPIPNNVGVSNLSMRTFHAAMASSVPTFFVMYNPKNEAHLSYCDILVAQVTRLNKSTTAHEKGPVFSNSTDKGLILKLGLVDVTKDRPVAELLKCDPDVDEMPQVFFCRGNQIFDKMVGVVAESFVIEASQAFVDFCIKDAEGEGKSALKKPDELDENPMTLIVAGNNALKEKNLSKARDLYQKAYDMSVKLSVVIKKDLGFDRKEPTDAMWKSLRKNAVYNAGAQALAGLAMSAMIDTEKELAVTYVERLKKEFPHAATDMVEVASAIARVEIIIITDYNIQDTIQVQIHSKDKPEETGAAFYKRQLQLSADFFLNARMNNAAMDVLLRLIRSEPKLLPELKEAGIVPRETKLQGLDCTPARKVLKLIYASLGETREEVIDSRKKLQAIT